jgi:DNA polymerase (family 10)
LPIRLRKARDRHRETAMTNQAIAQIMVHISEILDIQGENPFKIRSYIKASQTIANLTYELSSLKDKNEIGELPGIGEGIARKITELLETGKLKYYEDLKKSQYAPLTEFLKIPGMGPKHAKLVHDKLGISTVDELKQAAEEGKLRELHVWVTITLRSLRLCGELAMIKEINGIGGNRR